MEELKIKSFKFTDPTLIKFIEEPWIKATIITPDQYLGSIIKMCQGKRYSI